MTTVIQGESPRDNSGGIAIALVLILVVGVALGIAYMNGAFTGAGPSTTVIENKTIEHKTDTVVVPVQVPAPAEAPAP